MIRWLSIGKEAVGLIIIYGMRQHKICQECKAVLVISVQCLVKL